MRTGAKKALILLFLTTCMISYLTSCKPISDKDAVVLKDTSSETPSLNSEIDSETISSDNTSSAVSSATSSSTFISSGNKGNLIIVDKDKDVGKLDDPEDPMKPPHSGDTADKQPEDTVTIPPVSSAAPSQSSAASSSSSQPASSASHSSQASSSGTSSHVSSAAVTSSVPSFNPPANGWYTYEGETYLYQNSKPVTGYQTANGITYYFNDKGVLSSKAGIDVSKYQGDIDWNKVKNSGVDFAIIRIGYRGYGSAGNIVKDPKFLQNIINATNVGIDCGLYFFTQATNKAEAEEEAQKVVDWIEEARQNTAWTAAGKKKLTYPIYFDTEASGATGNTGRADKLTRSQRTETALAFCSKIKALGYFPGIYASTSWLNNQLNMSALTAFDVWVAHYRAGGPTYQGAYRMWQYTSEGTVNGINGNVDRNVGLFDYPDYIRKNKFNHLG